MLCGGNDAVLAAFSGGLDGPGRINMHLRHLRHHQTCASTHLCARPNFNVRCHVLPGRWVTFFVLNTGGKALEWFHSVFCREMPEDDFYRDYMPAGP